MEHWTDGPGFADVFWQQYQSFKISNSPPVCTASQQLAEEDLNTIWAFTLKVHNHLSDKTYKRFPYASPSVSLPSLCKSCSHLENLAGFKAVLYDCCPNSRMCYTGPHNTLDHCLHCKEPWWNAAGEAHQKFKYIPLIPHLWAAHAHKSWAQQMCYCVYEHHHTSGKMSDIFDSTHYRDLLQKNVTVDSEELPFYFFSDPWDIALGLSTDGFTPFKNGNRQHGQWFCLITIYHLIYGSTWGISSNLAQFLSQRSQKMQIHSSFQLYRSWCN